MKMSSSEFLVGRRGHESIGSLLVQMGVLEPKDIDRVLQLHQQQKLRFGEAAVQLRLISESDLMYALSRQFSFSYSRPVAGGSQIDPEVVAAHEPFGPRSDQIRSIRSQLLLRWYSRTQRRNALCVIGSEASEGRSYLAANLATVFAQAGETTLLIDANMRQPHQHRLFGVGNDIGLSSVLAGYRPSEAIVGLPELPGLFLMPSGPVPPNPLELLSQLAWTELVSHSRNDFDCVIIDTPALAIGEDAAFVAARCGAALAVARTGLTRVSTFSRMLRGLANAGVSVVGSVWNDVPSPARK